jgi:hypothetical protein
MVSAGLGGGALVRNIATWQMALFSSDEEKITPAIVV